MTRRAIGPRPIAMSISGSSFWPHAVLRRKRRSASRSRRILFTFFKFPLRDLEALYGAIVQELSIYDSVEAHAIEQAARGRAVLVEVDGFYLPDTRGVSYRRQHTKTTIAIDRIDPASNSLEYFHNAGFFALDGEDYDGVFAKLPQQQRDDILFPYVEFVRFDGEAP